MKRKSPDYWTKETIMEEAKKYTTKISWYKNSKGSYNKAKIIGCFDEATLHITNNIVTNRTLFTQGLRKCSTCREIKDLNAFHNDASKAMKKANVCKICSYQRLKQRERDNPEYFKEYYKKLYQKNAEKTRDTQLKRKYGITNNDYRRMLIEQNNVCRICKLENNRGLKKEKNIRMAVDHNHKTGQIRGLLCSSCNTALGLFNENIEILQQAIDYLNFFESPHVGRLRDK